MNKNNLHTFLNENIEENLINKIKLQIKIELNKIVHWEIYNGSKEKENHIKKIVTAQLFKEYNKIKINKNE